MFLEQSASSTTHQRNPVRTSGQETYRYPSKSTSHHIPAKAVASGEGFVAGQLAMWAEARQRMEISYSYSSPGIWSGPVMGAEAVGTQPEPRRGWDWIGWDGMGETVNRFRRGEGEQGEREGGS